MDELMDVPGVARALKVSTLTIRRYIGRGALKAVRLGRRVLVEPQEVERFVSDARRTAERRDPKLQP